jgi:hypothetical protein
MLFLGGGGTFAISSALPAHSTPLGSHANEFCALDRAMIFEDPDGTRILYDAGRTARGPEDPRLGNINVVLLSHVHGDHLGDVIQPSPNVGECGKPDFSVKVTPKSNTVNIVVAKKSLAPKWPHSSPRRSDGRGTIFAIGTGSLWRFVQDRRCYCRCGARAA